MQTSIQTVGGVYLHIPFCYTLCPYCNFAIVKDAQQLHQPYLAALQTSMVEAAKSFSVATLYIGGGTPSRLSSSQLSMLTQTLDHYFPKLATGLTEVTLEVNPEDISFEKLSQWRQLGINRLSIGVQRLYAAELKLLGRQRSANSLVELPAYLQAWQALGGQVSVDLMYGLPHESLASWQTQVETVLAWPIDHLSAYALTVEPKTPYARATQKKILTPADDDLVATCYLALLQALEQHGWQAYEVSNFCRPGAMAKHNTAYWQGHPYLGFGLGAASYEVDAARKWRYQRVRHWETFIADPLAVEQVEDIGKEEEIVEALLLGLRSFVGVKKQYWQQWLASRGKTFAQLLQDQGIIDVYTQTERVYLQPQKRLMAEEIAARWAADIL